MLSVTFVSMSELRIISGISKATRALLDEKCQKQAIQSAVSALGAGTEVDRCYIFQVEREKGMRYISQRFEWAKDSVSVQIDNPTLQMVPVEAMPWLMEKLNADEILYGLVSESDDPFFKEAMAEQDIKSYLFTPIQSEGELWGFIGYDDCVNERNWQQVEVEALATVAKNIGIRLGWDAVRARLEERQEMFELAVEGAELGMWEWIPRTNEVKLSSRSLRMMGYEVGEVEPDYNFWVNHIHPGDLDNVLKELKSYLNANSERYEVLYRMVQKDGSIRWVQANGTAKKDMDGKPLKLTGFQQDVTSRVLSEEARNESLRKAMELSDLKSNFVSMASHQFRTPLTVIYSNVELVEMRLNGVDGNIPDNIRKSIGRIKDEVERMTELMNNILTFGKYEAGLMTIRFGEVQVTEMLERIDEQYFSNEPDGRRFVFTESGTRRAIVADQMLLTHAFSNLMSNAMKYSKGRPSPEINIAYLNQVVRVIITDYGIGIPEKEQVNMFNSFFRASNASTFVGSGLGLPIVKEFIEKHGGNIKFESAQNVGTKFIVELLYENE